MSKDSATAVTFRHIRRIFVSIGNWLTFSFEFVVFPMVSPSEQLLAFVTTPDHIAVGAVAPAFQAKSVH